MISSIFTTRLDPNVSFDKQIVNNVAPVVLLSTFLVKHEHVQEFLAGFRKQFAIMRSSPDSSRRNCITGSLGAACS